MSEDRSYAVVTLREELRTLRTEIERATVQCGAAVKERDKFQSQVTYYAHRVDSFHVKRREIIAALAELGDDLSEDERRLLDGAVSDVDVLSV